MFKKGTNDDNYSLSFASREWILLYKAFYHMSEGKTCSNVFYLLLKKKHIHLKTSFKFTSKVKSAATTLQLICEKWVVISF